MVIGRKKLLACALLCVAFCLLRGLFWEYRYDEGTTFDVAIGEVTAGEFLEPWPAPAVPVEELVGHVEGRSDYDSADVLDALDVRFRTFHPPAFYLLTHHWTKAFGTGRIAMRLPAYLIAAIALLGIARLAQRVAGDRAGLWAGTLFALSPFVHEVTNYARPYGMVLAIAIWAWVMALGIANGERRRWVPFVLLSLLGLYTIYHYVFAFVTQLALLGIHALLAEREMRWVRVRRIAVAGLAIALAYLPWGRRLFVHTKIASEDRNYFQQAIEVFRWPRELGRLLGDFALADTPPGWGREELLWVVGVLGVVTLVLALRSFRAPARGGMDAPARAFWLSAPLLPLSMLVGDKLHGSHTFFITKINYALFPLLLLLVVRACTLGGGPRLARTGLLLWAALLGLSASIATLARAQRPSDTEALVPILRAHDDPEHLIVLSTDQRDYIVPFLLVLRDHGSWTSRVTVLERADPGATLDALLASRELDSVTLVAYGTHVGERVRDAIERSARAGWRTVVGARPWDTLELVHEPQVPGPTREMRILGPALVATLSGRP